MLDQQITVILSVSGFADGRSKTSPDSPLHPLAPCGRGQGEGSMCTVAKQHVRNSVSVEQIQDSEESLEVVLFPKLCDVSASAST